ncbi:MAG TPA: phosphoribosylformylglycinamidine synthase subunit PurQ, partial [Pirellulaceae bacterium]|nr:phosphoribosylformylglycinamidine synthase subunit PurQ [Pirellulaceae bacterium]
MANPHVLILRAPGTNCENETAYAFDEVGAEAEIVHLNVLLESPGRLKSFQILCFPGGFSYGDDVSAGHVAALRIRKFLSHELADMVQTGGFVLGIFNGFPILVKSGVLFPPQQSVAFA